MTDPVDDLPRRWLPAAVAAGVVLIAAGGVYAVTRPDESVPFGVAEEASLVVREGAEVEATGRLSGTPMRFCAPATTTAINDGACPFSVPVTGLDAAPDGNVRLRGVWKAGVLEVKQRLDPLPDPVRDWGAPCARPA